MAEGKGSSAPPLTPKDFIAGVIKSKGTTAKGGNRLTLLRDADGDGKYEGRAMVWQVDSASGATRPFATGLRNPTALAFEPSQKGLWTVVNERDELGPDLVPDYLTSVREGAFYGWPYAYWGPQCRHPGQAG